LSFLSSTGVVKVSVVKVPDYDCQCIHEALEKSIELIGGLPDCIRAGAKVFVKINHLPPASSAERGIITHPIFTEAFLRLVGATGARITVGDDIESSEGYKVSNYYEMCKRLGVNLVNLKDIGFRQTECNDRFLNKVYFSKAILDADVVINLPKLKTHSLTVITGGVKNMYGAIPSGLRTKFHAEYPDSEDFAHVLSDVFSVRIPELTIMDGIVVMEGEGPASGRLKKLGLIFASRDAVALDSVVAKIIGLRPMGVPTTRCCHERSLGIGTLERIEVVGQKIDDVAIVNFKYPIHHTSVLADKAPRFLFRFFVGQIAIRPRVIRSKCTGCCECERICPVSAISMRSDSTLIEQSKCIGCLCCNEVCQFGAIEVRRPIIGRLLHMLYEMRNKFISRS
jgi:uncharacterized protein (DUF362 family)/Pyruvate/2-oxoacid:ferredoxin oxidoreductase delta subunit